ncbi:MAG: bifunctional DNA-formamidopyrimidine glycosylase/DNA-(apurinic or apyrimidinic site) lyase [Gammaproteobacteria bacterium]|nr:bifunctional DNA-formamidopyrimidine glycosylase/DNA-(apurinic or apyrimidinic site) lyase [Gammaproteobacteria bacterium]
MPELPEVETSRRGIEPYILNQQVIDVVVRQKKLRWPIPARLKSELIKQKILAVGRRGKYLLLETGIGTVLIHLGMSGSLRIVDKGTAPEKHDHIDIAFNNNKVLRLRDPRRFGSVLWTRKDPAQHKLLSQLGPEPLSDEFNADYLYQQSRSRKVAIKLFIMNSQVVVGVGNIYANEALFMAGINPKRQASRISYQRYQILVACIKEVLQLAIQQGGTSLQDFTQQDGKPGYFQQILKVYGKTNQPCLICHQPIRQLRQQQRSTFYCSQCQS